MYHYINRTQHVTMTYFPFINHRQHQASSITQIIKLLNDESSRAAASESVWV